MAGAPPTGAGVRIWDLPVRLFHWSIVLLIPALWWTAENGRMELHLLLGEILLGLLLFRLLWGVLGSSTARFASFVKGPVAVIRYLRGNGPGIGHNPLGALSVVAMLLALGVQIGLGLFASDEDGIYAGPLSHRMPDLESAHELAERHETFFWVLVALIALHLLAVLYYLVVKRSNLVAPMVTGRGPAGEAGQAMVPAPWWRFVLAVALAVGMTLAILKLL
ncbi:MAG TPA: cytochrome b/b6 domain-containing protein [Allosphingosinicella sp.]|nr:cytochrome b/b6 domain-containing protein [Allosphingosinicella sp.]